MGTGATSSRRIRSESTYEFRAPNRDAAIAALQSALDDACRDHPEVRTHQISDTDGEIEIAFELDLSAQADPQRIVLEIVEAAVSAMGGRISSGLERPRKSESTAVFERLGTYLVPA